MEKNHKTKARIHTPKDRDLLSQKEKIFKAFCKRIGTISMISKRTKVSKNTVKACIDEWTKRECIAIIIDARCEVTNQIDHYYTANPVLVNQCLKTANHGE